MVGSLSSLKFYTNSTSSEEASLTTVSQIPLTLPSPANIFPLTPLPHPSLPPSLPLSLPPLSLSHIDFIFREVLSSQQN